MPIITFSVNYHLFFLWFFSIRLWSKSTVGLLPAIWSNVSFYLSIFLFLPATLVFFTLHLICFKISVTIFLRFCWSTRTQTKKDKRNTNGLWRCKENLFHFHDMRIYLSLTDSMLLRVSGVLILGYFEGSLGISSVILSPPRSNSFERSTEAP